MSSHLSLKVEKRDMNIKPQDKTIKELLLSGRQFVIPRFQREYSWDKKNYKEFLDDMLNCLIINNSKITYDQYFLGTMLFVGDCFEDDKTEIDVVDGQQRLTTITILFSALSDRFIQINEKVLSEQIFRYIMTSDDDGNSIRIIKSKTHYPFFSFYIQDREKTENQQPSSEEEQCIKEAYEYMYGQLEEAKLRNVLKKRFGNDDVEKLSYVDILKAIRDQVLNTTFVSISTKERRQANMIFEILNAKGKNLSGVDLIKNVLFELVNDTEPADFAEEKWKTVKEILNDSGINVGFAQFYRHFWISKYKKSSVAKLYDDFKTFIKPKTKERYKAFLQELEYNAKLYVKVVAPQRKDFSNKKEYFGIVQSMNVLSDYFNIVQVRIALIALLEAKDRELLKLSQIKKCIYYLEGFHFSYNAIASKPTNKLESLYSKFAIKLRKASSKEDAQNCIDELINNLEKIYVSYQEFEEKFIQLRYSKKDDSSNLKSKYVLNKIASYYENSDVFDDEGSVEHILPETVDSNTNNNIGNLILLEQKLNECASALSYGQKKEIYKDSRYKWVEKFLSDYNEWNTDCIEERSRKLSKFYYTEILKRSI